MKWTANHFSPEDLEYIRTDDAFGHTHVALRMSVQLNRWVYMTGGSERHCRNVNWPTDCGPFDVYEVRRILSDIDRPGAP